MGTTLVVNPGSSSRKYALYCDGVLALELRYENTDTGFEMCMQISGQQQICTPSTSAEFGEASANVAEEVRKYLFRERNGAPLERVAIRIVAPGSYFQRHAVVDDAYLAKLRQRESAAPLHVPVMLREIEQARRQFKHAQIIAVSDSAFHSTLPSQAREYSIANTDAREFDIYRFGYHGLSVASIVRRIHAVIGQQPERMIVCHIGSGTSVTAVRAGKSVETTMGFSPSTGLPMSSRAGDLDSAALLELMRVKHWRPADAEAYINSSGGLAGIAGDSDIRRLLDRRAQHDETATHALEVFAYHIQKAIAAETIVLGGLDVLVFTATAAVRSSELRSIILRRLTHLGVHISPDRNDALVGRDGTIHVRNSAVKVVVMRTDEMGEMAAAAAAVNVKRV